MTAFSENGTFIFLGVGEPFGRGINNSSPVIPDTYETPITTEEILQDLYVVEVTETGYNEGYFVLYCTTSQCEYKYHVKVGDTFDINDHQEFYYVLPSNATSVPDLLWVVRSIENNHITFVEISPQGPIAYGI